MRRDEWTQTFEDVPVDQLLLLWSKTDGFVQLVDRLWVEGWLSDWLWSFGGCVGYPLIGSGRDYTVT